MDLANVDVKLNGELLIIKLFCSLPTENKHFHETVLYGKKSVSSKKVRNALMQRELIETQLTPQIVVSQGNGLIATKDRSHKKGSSSK